IAEVVRPGIVAVGLRLDATTQVSLPAIEGYSNQLQQVVLNLLTNAVDATPAGGRIAVTTGTRDRHVELAVSDTGRGIPAAEQTQIFEPFFSTKGGSGLGLFISAQIVREHHGRIEVTSQPGQGSTFRVLLAGGERAGRRAPRCSSSTTIRSRATCSSRCSPARATACVPPAAARTACASPRPSRATSRWSTCACPASTASARSSAW